MTDENEKKDNWTLILEEYRFRIGDYYKRDRDGKIFHFYGLVDGADDYYYGLNSLYDSEFVLASCVGSLEGFGFTYLDGFIDTRCFQWDCNGECEIITYSETYKDDVFVEGLQQLKCKTCKQTRESKYQHYDRVDKIIAKRKEMGLD